ncbi:HK97 family phage prohead protease [Heyndrickxia coagulans]|uniref:HK97 family phage prohead protease n=1 Tax=Heyndrickxia coagulans TaxID=1398 RepID=UPI002E0B672A|nr:HK97 family phage prohead protease [Heyndrickxia coagulans]MEC5268266.1 HK97 family phage prohead protease [Heyndrickxia coagulans]
MDKPEKEIRTIQTEIRLRDGTGDEPAHIVGYALKFNRDSDILGYWTPFIERISPQALDSTDMSNVVATFNHEANMPLARNTVQSGAGSLSLTVDEIGLKFDFIPTDTSYSRDLMENMRAGVINQCSFAFTVADEDGAEDIEYDNEAGIYRRTINKIDRLYDVSVVTTPAYPDTEAVVSSRKLENIVSRSKEMLKLQLDLLEMNIYHEST